MKILVTGGAGFIGSFLVDELINQGHTVHVYDNLTDQVHHGVVPSYLHSKAIFVKKDVRDVQSLTSVLSGIDIVYHLASRVGVGQSNYEIREYTDANVTGIATLLDCIVNQRTPIKKIIMTASMTSYGEGPGMCQKCGIVKPDLRPFQEGVLTDFSVHCPLCGLQITPIPATEDTILSNNSIYSLTKNMQEELLMFIGKTYGIPTVSFRCFNVYGPRQSLSNPYTGVAAIFISRLKNGKAPVIYEDGLQSRDFISVHDVVRALTSVLATDKADGHVLNLGTGIPTSVKEIAVALARLQGKKITPEITRTMRKGDIRQCTADITKVHRLLKWKPEIDLEHGLEELVTWSRSQHAVDGFDTALNEMKKRKLI